MPPSSTDAPPFDGDPRWAAELRPRLERIPCFRAPTRGEIARSFSAYREPPERRVEALFETWRTACPTRATPTGMGGFFYRQAHRLPRALRRASFLATLRAVLAAGRALFDEQLRPETARAIRERFAWLEVRHGHVPDGFTPPLRFTPVFAEWIEGGDRDTALARFQLAAALNEVQQSVYSRHLSHFLDLPELARHADYERRLADEYFARYSPPCTEALWEQTMWILDALNAQVFALTLAPGFSVRMLAAARHADAEWAELAKGI